jgi:hypothetical protein
MSFAFVVWNGPLFCPNAAGTANGGNNDEKQPSTMHTIRQIADFFRHAHLSRPAHKTRAALRMLFRKLFHAGLELPPVAMGRAPSKKCKLTGGGTQSPLGCAAPVGRRFLPNRLTHFINLNRYIAVFPQPCPHTYSARSADSSVRVLVGESCSRRTASATALRCFGLNLRPFSSQRASTQPTAHCTSES